MAAASVITLGVDTHKDLHVAVTLDALGRRLGIASFPTDDAHHADLWQWVAGFGQLAQAGVEGTGSYGYRLAQFLTGRGITVFEVNRPDRAARRRRGKSDPVDAENAARAVLSGDATATPKTRTGPAGQLRALLVARRSATKSRTQAELQLRSLILELDDDQRAQLDRRRTDHLAAACATLTGADGISLALASLARRWQFLDTEVRANTAQVEAIVRQTAPRLQNQPGIGPITAAQLLATAGDNPDRLSSEAAFAALCGVSPVEHSSGKTQRHRLNLGGDRAANSALWTIANNRLMHDPRIREYAARRTALGSSRKEILRLLKRYIARQVFTEIRRALTPPKINHTRDLT
ncbi:IS110 family transposase [Verrucosispora sp. ts21]|uniref:IS110 family transposase n=1 Tax=Verrucosispora sp. ts21 TaxID=2069341 RepID=UPI000C87FFAE|nr:IS110 family transposase [Verrucosispora sp. ts21]PMR62131.1 IS110 family transposase [Verrucosispora sp. ts21]